MTLLPSWSAGVHHDGSAFFVSNPLPTANEVVTVRLRTPLDAPLKHVFLKSVPDGEIHLERMRATEETPVALYWSATLRIANPRNNYRFKLMTHDGALYYNAAGISRAESPDYFDFMLLADYNAPTWVRETVFYQIFPERFYNGDPSLDVADGEYSREGFQTMRREWGEIPYPWTQQGSLDFFGGDLPGIVQKLDYIAELGVNALYLCPVFEAQSNHKYDITDFFNVDQHFGGNKALAELRQATSTRNMRLMLDITPNHISFKHPWFTQAQQDANAPTAEYFKRNETTGAYETWLGVSSLIKLNYASQKLRDVMYRHQDSALRRWLQPPYSIDGWRLDVSNMTGNLGMTQLDHEVWREMRPYLKQDNPTVYILGENFHDGTPHTQGDELDAIMNYMGFNIPMRRWLGGEDLGVADGKDHGDTHLLPTEAMAEQWRHFMAAVPYVIALQQFNQLGSHDTTRILTVTGGDKALVKLGTTLLLTFPGVPCLYYGDEIGMVGGKDPDNRRCMPWDHEVWDEDLLAYNKRLIEIRRNSAALQHGGFQLLYAEGDLVAFQRHAPGEILIIVGYRGQDQSPAAAIPVVQGGIADGRHFVDRISNARYTVKDGAIVLSGLPHGQALILALE